MKSLAVIACVFLAANAAADDAKKDTASQPHLRGSAIPQPESLAVHQKFFGTVLFNDHRASSYKVEPNTTVGCEDGDKARIAITHVRVLGLYQAVGGTKPYERWPGHLSLAVYKDGMAAADQPKVDSAILPGENRSKIRANSWIVVDDQQPLSGSPIIVSERGKGIVLAIHNVTHQTPLNGSHNAVRVVFSGYWFYDVQTHEESEIVRLRKDSQELQGRLLRELIESDMKSGEIRSLEKRVSRLETHLKDLMENAVKEPSGTHPVLPTGKTP